ncbi:MAG TPA: Uma2 family endonuclease [Leptospiraceae bacterium]|nr:Uma2 family endonuclease [Leptospiraceae bacterium]HNI99840.1 Uma2 family endonuclease [Leptospiraceae bacterium]HNN06726.1 Uma2 family endonuclease [Leptospiraceae bacterium]
MTTLLEHPAVQALVNRMSLSDYHRLAELGLLPEKIELIDGVLINKMPKSPKHAFTVDYLLSVFRNIFHQNFIIRSEQPLSIGNSEPEPDISIISGTLSDFKSRHPDTARLTVEISVSTYELDFQKQFIYADADVQEYWIINLKDRELEVYKNPSSGKYLEKKIFRSSDAVELEGTKISLREILD